MRIHDHMSAVTTNDDIVHLLGYTHNSDTEMFTAFSHAFDFEGNRMESEDGRFILLMSGTQTFQPPSVTSDQDYVYSTWHNADGDVDVDRWNHDGTSADLDWIRPVGGVNIGISPLVIAVTNDRVIIIIDDATEDDPLNSAYIHNKSSGVYLPLESFAVMQELSSSSFELEDAVYVDTQTSGFFGWDADNLNLAPTQVFNIIRLNSFFDAATSEYIPPAS